MTTESNTVEITTTGTAWLASGREALRLRVDGDVVRVYDDVAGHYTVAHSLAELDPAVYSKAIDDARRLIAGKIDESATCHFA